MRKVPSRRNWLLGTSGVLALSLAATLPAVATAVPSTPGTDSKVNRPEQRATATAPWVRATLRRLSVEEKVGQLFVLVAYGDRADTATGKDAEQNRTDYGVDTFAKIIDRYRPGGVIYFTWSNNLKSARQVAELSNGLQKAALAQPAKVPLLISTDQEQGVVNRLGTNAAWFPAGMGLGAGRRTADAELAARITGQELRAVGIQQNFAPDADVNVNQDNPVIGSRSFSSDPKLAATMTAAQVRGYQRATVAATAKHFPGHGDTDVDSHYGLPVINHTREQWEKLDAPPFRSAIRAGVDAVMTAHIVVPALDPSEDPATLSEPILTGILRKKLGYRGVIVTDSLRMEGVRKKYGDDQVPVRAVKAGADQLLMPPKPELAFKAVVDAVRSGQIPMERLDASVARILKLKADRGIVRSPYVDVDAVGRKVATPAHLKAAQNVADRGITLVRNENRQLPLAKGAATGTTLVIGPDKAVVDSLTKGLTERGNKATPMVTEASPTKETVDRAVAAARQADRVLVATSRAWNWVGQRQLVNSVHETGKPLTVVAFREPHDIAFFPKVGAYLAAYSFAPPVVDAALRVLFGEKPPVGRLPIAITQPNQPDQVLYPFGHGLSYPKSRS